MSTQVIPRPSFSHRSSRWFSRNLIRIYAALAFVYLFIPVAYTFAFSFNDSGKSNLVWKGFTLDNWKNPCGAPQVCKSVANSLQIGVISTVVATILGTMIAFAISRHSFKGRKTTNLLIFLPMATPEVVLGASLLAMFLNLRINPGFWTIVIAHVMFCISFVVVTVKARVASLDPRTLEASGDLYASGFTTFRKVTVPLSMPGVVAGTLLTFIPAAGDYVNAALLGNPSTKMIGNVIESRFFAVVDYPTAAALSFTLMATILILVTLYIRKSGTDELV